MFAGIIRDSSCVLKSEQQAHICGDSLDYELLIVESMDDDTLTRRLSPIGNVLMIQNVFKSRAP